MGDGQFYYLDKYKQIRADGQSSIAIANARSAQFVKKCCVRRAPEAHCIRLFNPNQLHFFKMFWRGWHQQTASADFLSPIPKSLEQNSGKELDKSLNTFFIAHVVHHGELASNFHSVENKVRWNQDSVAILSLGSENSEKNWPDSTRRARTQESRPGWNFFVWKPL